MKQSKFIKPDGKMKNNPWHTICFGWIMLAMEDNGESEMENASEANKILNYLIRNVRKEAQVEELKKVFHLIKGNWLYSEEVKEGRYVLLKDIETIESELSRQKEV